MRQQDPRGEIWLVLDTDQLVSGIHAGASCSGTCPVHAKTEHWMREFPLGYDVENSSFYRLCDHGFKHQDPDERTRWTNIEIKNLRKPGSGARSTARERLDAWPCPDCPCGCCEMVERYLT